VAGDANEAEGHIRKKNQRKNNMQKHYRNHKRSGHSFTGDEHVALLKDAYNHSPDKTRRLRASLANAAMEREKNALHQTKWAEIDSYGFNLRKTPLNGKVMVGVAFPR
jgi:hypothetical protein